MRRIDSFTMNMSANLDSIINSLLFQYISKKKIFIHHNKTDNRFDLLITIICHFTDGELSRIKMSRPLVKLTKR